MRNVWNSWTGCDSDGNWVRSNWVWSKEDTLGKRYGKTCRAGITGNATTGVGRLFQNIMTNSLERTMDLSEVRMERIIKIRTAIANGCYNVSSADLAQKLIGNMLGDFR